MVEITPDILKEAFKKLLTATYYDKTDMVMRYNVAKLAKKISSEDKNKEDEFFYNLVEVVKGEKKDSLDEWLNNMRLSFYPKKVTSRKDNKDDHIITDISPKNVTVERLMVKANIPVELCILDVAWLLLYGYKIDDKGSECSYGNRLDIKKDRSGVRSGNALFKKYQNQYKNWWENGIKAANKYLEERKDVTIINFDIHNCYHSIVFNFDEFFNYYKDKLEDDIENDNLTKIIKKIYERYWELVKNAPVNIFENVNKEKGPLPLTLMSAHVLANWYLSPLDEYIKKKYTLCYYYGRYVDDCMIVVETKSSKKEWKDIIEEELTGLLNKDKTGFDFNGKEDFDDNDKYKRLSSLKLQEDKIYVYKFNCKLPPLSLEKFKQEQMERSSEFRFLTDDFDTSNRNLESVTLVNTLDPQEEKPGRRFNILEENKYKLAVYLAKLSSDLSKYIGNENKDKVDKLKKEVDKVYNFFTEGYLGDLYKFTLSNCLGCRGHVLQPKQLL